MTDSRRRQTTGSLPKKAPSKISGKSHPRWAGYTRLDLVGKRYGLVTVISSKLRRENGYIKLKVKCTKCGNISWRFLDNLIKATTGCKPCGMLKSPYQKILGARYDAIVQRCNKPHYPGYEDYGARGIRCRFSSRTKFVQWVVKNLPHPTYRGVTIDRIDNDGHYEPGNLRLATQSEQNRNRRNTPKMKFRGKDIYVHEFDSPYGQSWTWRLVNEQRMTGEQIIQNAIARVQRGKRSKMWKQLTAWLKSHGYTTS